MSTLNDSCSRWRSKKLWLVIFGLVCVVGIIYANSFQSGFVLDNEFIIQGDPRLRAATWKNVWLIFTEDYWYPRGVGGLFRPLTTLSFLTEYSLFGFGQNPTYYHFLNVLLHAMNASLVYLLLQRLLKRLDIAMFAAALFAVHPIATESVTNLVGRSDLLAALSVLSGTLFYLKSVDCQGYKRWLWLLLMAVSMALGVFSKENAVVLLGILPLYDWLYRVRSTPFSLRGSLQDFFGYFCRGYLVLVPIVIALFVIRYAMLQSHGSSLMAWKDNPIRATDFLSGRLTAVKVIGYYLGLLVFPLRLSCDYTLDAIPNSSWRMTSWEDLKAVLSLVLLTISMAVVWLCYRRGIKSLLFFTGWFFITLMPTANLLFLIDSNMAERFLYLPLVGFAGLMAVALHFLATKIHRHGFLVLGILVISMLGYRTILRNQDWRTNLTLWTSASEVCPGSFRVQRSLAIVMIDQKAPPIEVDQIIDVAKKAAAIASSLPIEQGDQLSHFVLGMLYGQKADQLVSRDSDGSVVLTDEVRPLYEQSIIELERAALIAETIAARRAAMNRSGAGGLVSISTGPAHVYDTLWLVYSRVGRHGDAAKILRKMQEINPLSLRVYRFLPDELVLSGNPSEAGIVLIQALLINAEHEFTVKQLTSIYAPDSPGTQPIVVKRESTLSFDLANPVLRADVNTAFVQLAELFLRRGEREKAEQLRGASQSYQVAPVLLDAVFDRYPGER
jgi:protein O-mannosyl-transferase